MPKDVKKDAVDAQTKKGSDVKPKPLAVEGDEKKQKKKKANFNSLTTYIARINASRHPGIEMGQQSLTVVDDIVHSMFVKIAHQANDLRIFGRRRTVSDRDIQYAAKLHIPECMLPDALARLEKAVAAYSAYCDDEAADKHANSTPAKK